MIPDSGQGLKDRSLVDKLALEEKHEYLMNTLPLYRKISLALIPPLQNSLHLFHGSSDHLDEATRDSPDARNKRHAHTASSDLSASHGLETSNSTPGEDIDVAQPLGEESVLNLFFGMLATALVYAGVDSIKYFKNLLVDKTQKDGENDDLERFKLSLIGYSLYESDSKLESEALNYEDEPFEALDKNQTRRKSDLRRTETKASTLRLGSEEPRSGPSDFVFSQSLHPQNYKLPPVELRTTFHESVMENLDLTSIDDEVLVQKDQSQYSGSKEETDFLKCISAEKLQDSFELSDNDYYYARFTAWVIKDVLLQGTMHVTGDALCFYSLVPGELTATDFSDPDHTLHSGALGHKTGRYGDSYFSSVYTHRFWGVLKPQTLSIYTSPTEQYFPVKVIDLNEALYCEIIHSNPNSAVSPELASPPQMTTSNSETLLSQLASETSSLSEEDNGREDVQSGVWFRIVCKDKTYRFHTNSIYSARHWYNSITKVIFRLHNTNSQREVLLKIPMHDLLDFKKNYVLAEEFDNFENDSETPVSFTFKYAVPPAPTNSRLEDFKNKTKNSFSRSPPYDFVHILFFNGGAKFEELVNLVLSANAYEDRSLNNRIRLKARQVLDSDSASSSSKSTVSYISTLQPEFSSGISLADKIARVNETLLSVRKFERQQLGYENDEDFSVEALVEKKKSMSRIMGLIKPKSTHLGSSSSTRSRTDSFRSMDMQLWEAQAKATFENWEANSLLQLPKPFSVLTLKNLRMVIVVKRRSFEEIATRFELMSIVKDENREKVQNDSSTFFDDERTFSDGEVVSREAVFPTGSDGPQELRGKTSKFKSFKRSIKTVSTMGGIWSAKPEHYIKVDELDPLFVKDEHERRIGIDHYQKHFSLPQDAELVATYYPHLKRSLPVYGKLYLGTDRLCFRSLLPGVSTRMILPLKEIDACEKEKGKKINYSGLHVMTHGEELVLEFATQKSRDDAYKMITLQIERMTEDKSRQVHEHIGSILRDDSKNEEQEHVEDLREKTLDNAMWRVRAARLRLLEDKVGAASGIEFPLIIDDSPFVSADVRPITPYRFTLLTIGSRGDVQPYIALGKGLMKEGHTVTIATHLEFKEWIEKHGIKFKEVAGNPAELMSLMVTHGSMSVSFLKEANAKFKNWINELLSSSWEACQDTDILIESPSAMGGIHIAEALNIPYMRAFTMPWTRTRAYPHAFIVPDSKRGGSYNYLTHVMFENVFWKGISNQVNRWRVETLGLPRTNLVKLQQYRIPFLYNVSPAMFPPSVDFPDWVKVTGYWFLDEGADDYVPPPELVKFIETARQNNEKVVYIGFGSIVVGDAKRLTRAVVEAVNELGVKCILNKGWSDRLSKNETDKEKSDIEDVTEIELSSLIYDSGNIPHDWLFPRIDGAVHHGGSGTTGATLRAGLPTVIKPFFGDQFFYASRVEELGVGISLKNLNTKSLTKALKSITRDEKYSVKAKAIAQDMQHETGVLTAIASIYSELAYAKSIITNIKHNTEARKNYDDKSGIQTPSIEEEALPFVGSMPSPEDNESEISSSSSEESDDYSSDEDEDDEEDLTVVDKDGKGSGCPKDQILPSLTSGIMHLMTGVSGHKP